MNDGITTLTRLILLAPHLTASCATVAVSEWGFKPQCVHPETVQILGYTQSGEAKVSILIEAYWPRSLSASLYKFTLRPVDLFLLTDGNWEFIEVVHPDFVDACADTARLSREPPGSAIQPLQDLSESREYHSLPDDCAIGLRSECEVRAGGLGKRCSMSIYASTSSANPIAWRRVGTVYLREEERIHPARVVTAVVALPLAFGFDVVTFPVQLAFMYWAFYRAIPRTG